MEETAKQSGSTQKQAILLRSLIIPLIGLLLILATGFLAYRFWISRPAGPSKASSNLTSEGEFEELSGLRVRLIGVTAAGGMIDFRLKITDAGKARQFLQDQANLPRLVVAESGIELMTPLGLDEEIEWKNNGILFMFYPNSNGVVQPGTPVILRFGDVSVGPILAQ